MAHIIDYIAWRGDIPFSVSPLNAVDALILSQLSYLQFGGIVPGDFTSSGTDAVPLSEVSKRFFASEDFKARSNVGAFINPLSVELLKCAGESVRFGSLKLSGYVEKLDYGAEEQFCAVTFSGPEWHFIAFRGTDDTILGWKEDFNLGYKERVPAQEDSLLYVTQAAAVLDGSLVIGGHSKGGNLALYSAAMAEESVQNCITAVYDNDGPGFSKEFFKSEKYARVKDVLHTYVPHMSIVGMLFCHPEQISIVENDTKDIIRQHDPFTWHVKATGFAECEELGNESRFFGETVNGWFSDLANEEKELFVETLFGILSASGAKTNSELSNNWFESSMKMIKSAASLNSHTKDAVFKTIQLLFKTGMEGIMRDIRT